MSKQCILVIDDSRIVRLKVKSLLEACGYSVLLAEGAEEGVRLHRAENPDCILLDYQMPGVSGVEFLSKLVADTSHGRVPIVMITGEGNESIAVDAMKAGAQDYLVKSEITQQNLQRAIARAIGKVAVERELVAKNKRIEQLTQELTETNSRLALASRLDPLTKLFNRRVFEEAITLEHERCVRHNRAYCVIMLDIDHFKQFNDTQGHQAGDECLQRVARCLNAATRDTDMVGRYGGEEFIVLVPETTQEDAQVLAENIRSHVYDLNIAHSASQTDSVVTISLGVAQGPAERWEEVVKMADEALYAAKRSGRNRVCAYETV